MRHQRKRNAVLPAIVAALSMVAMSTLTVYGVEKEVPVTMNLPKTDVSVDFYVAEVDTGDYTMLWLYLMLAMAAAISIIILLIFRRKKNKKDGIS